MTNLALSLEETEMDDEQPVTDADSELVPDENHNDDDENGVRVV